MKRVLTAAQKVAAAERGKRYYRAHPDRVLESHRRYRASPKGIAMVARKAARWAASPAGIAANSRRKIFVAGWLAEYKLSRGCMDCGYKVHSHALEFDHVRGEKLFNIGAYARCSQERVMAEITKCDLVCANCHRIRTHSRRLAK